MASSLGLPKSFEARGCLVGFQKTSLAQARLRAVPDGTLVEWEIMIPVNREKRNSSVMIMPWRQLNAYTSLADRDKYLYDAVDHLDEDHPDPLIMRRVRLAVDAEHHPDNDRRMDAKRAMQRDRRDRLNVYLSLLAQMTRDAGIGLGDTFMAHANTELLMKITQGDSSLGIDGEALTNRVLGFHAQKVGLAFKDVNLRLEAVADQAAVFGTMNLAETSARDGLFHHLKQRVLDFDLSLAVFESKAFSEIQNMSMMVRFAAKDFVKFIDEKTSMVEQILSNFSTALTESDRVQGIIKKTRRDVSYALDGWDALVEAWFAVEETGTTAEKTEVLQFIFNHLPLMPEEEVDTGSERGKVWKGFNAARVSVVRAMVSWSDNEVDQEMVERINRTKEAERLQREMASSNANGRRRK